MKIIFVTGLHRAGTHSTAKALADKHKLPYIEEGSIGFDSLEMVDDLCKSVVSKHNKDGSVTKYLDKSLDNGFVLQCPMLAHLTVELSGKGSVVWCDRKTEHIVRSMINCSIDDMAWDIMSNFIDKFPNDPIWETLHYDGSRDFPARFPKYYTLLIKVKRHFYETAFKKYAKKHLLEELLTYNVEFANNQKMKPKAKRLMSEVDTENESLRLY